MTNPEHSPLPLLRSFTQEALALHEATPAIFAALDADGRRFSTMALAQEIGLDEQPTELILGTMVADGSVTALSGRRWIETPRLRDVGEAYNTMYADFMAERMIHDRDGDGVRALALGRMSMAYGLGVSPFEAGPILAAAEQKGIGNPVCVTYRSLASLAVMERLAPAIERDILDFVHN